MRSPLSLLRRLAIEQPFRMLAKQILALLPCSIDGRALWDLSARPQYLVGVLFAAQEALRQGIPEISVIEFGVASGTALLVLQSEAEAAEPAAHVSSRVYGDAPYAGGVTTVF